MGIYFHTFLAQEKKYKKFYDNLFQLRKKNKAEKVVSCVQYS